MTHPVETPHDTDPPPEAGGDAPCWAHLLDEALPALDAQRLETVERRLGGDSDGLVICDGDGRIIAWTDGAERILGHERSRVVGASVDLFIPLPQRQRFWDNFFATLRSHVDPTAHGSTNLRLLDGDGSSFAVQVSLHVLWRDDDTVPTSVAVVFTRS